MTATVHAHNLLPNSEPAEGVVVFTVNTTKQVIRDPAGNVVFQGPLTVKLVAGEAEVQLPASDDVTLEPSGFTFTATEQLKHVSKNNYRVVDFQTIDGEVRYLADYAGTSEVALDPSYGASLNGALVEISDLRDSIPSKITDATATVNLRQYGADPDGVVPADAAWAALLADGVPDGTRVILDGDFLFNDTIRNSGKELHVEAYGSTLTRGAIGGTADEELVIFSGSYGTINAVASMSVAAATSGTPLTTTITITGGPVDLAVGDYCKVVSDDYVPASRTSTARVSWPAVVAAISGTTVTVLGGPYSGDTCATNIRIARVNGSTASWRGGRMKRAAAFVTPSVGGAMVQIRDLVSPQLADIVIPLSSGAGFSIGGCFGAYLENLSTNLLRDTWSDTGVGAGPVFAYHVLETNSQGTQLSNSRFSGGRHGFTTAQSAVSAGSTVLRGFGVVEHAKVHNVQVEGTYVACFDTHEASRGVQFSGVTAVGGGYAGIGLRGRSHSISDSQIIDCNRGIIIFDDELGGESYGHMLSDVLIDRPRLNAIEVDVHRDAAHPSSGVRQPIGITAFTADNVLVRGAKYSAVKLTNARVGRVNMRVVWDASPATQPQGLVELVNSEVRGGIIHSDNRLVSSNAPCVGVVTAGSDTSVLELDRVRVLGASAQVDRVWRSGSVVSVPLLRDVLLDSSPTNTAIQADASGVIDYQTLSGADTARLAVTVSTDGTTGLSSLGYSIRPVLTIQALLTASRNMPNLPAGRVQGQIVNILNRPATTGGSTAGANLTVKHGTTANTYMGGAVDKVLAPGSSAQLQWDTGIGRWVELI